MSAPWICLTSEADTQLPHCITEKNYGLATLRLLPKALLCPMMTPSKNLADFSQMDVVRPNCFLPFKVTRRNINLLYRDHISMG